MLDHGDASVCTIHPGFDVDLIVDTDAVSMTRVFAGIDTLAQARERGTVRISTVRRDSCGRSPGGSCGARSRRPSAPGRCRSRRPASESRLVVSPYPSEGDVTVTKSRVQGAVGPNVAAGRGGRSARSPTRPPPDGRASLEAGAAVKNVSNARSPTGRRLMHEVPAWSDERAV